MVTELKLITPQGKQMIVTERERDLMRVLRSSFGLLGVVHEVVLRVRPLTPVKIDYQVLTLKEFSAPLRLASSSARRTASAHFTVQRPDHGRTPHARRIGVHEPLRDLADSQFRDAQRAAGIRLDRRQRAGGARPCAAVSGVQRALRATLDRAARGVVMYAHEWMRDLPSEAWKARYTYSLWAFPQADYPEAAGRVLRVLQVLLQAAPLSLQRRQRREPPASGPRFAVQRELHGPHVHARALLHGRRRLG